MNGHSGNNNRRDRDVDAALIRAFKSGEKQAFERLVLRHRDRIFNICYRFLGDYQEAEDTAQDIFVNVYRSLKQFRFKSSFYTWLYRIAVNTCKNKLKSLGYRLSKVHVPLGHMENGANNHLSGTIPDGNKSPLLEMEKKERMELIQKLINSMPTDQKTVIILRDIEDLSYGEIADITGIKPGTLKSRLSRARMNLKEKLGGYI